MNEEEESSNILPILDEPVREDAGDGNEASSSVTQGERTEPEGVEGRYGWASSGTSKGVVHIIPGATGDISLLANKGRRAVSPSMLPYEEITLRKPCV